MYADDIILLSASLHGLHELLNCCYNVSIDLRLKFNCDKSCCIVFGARAKLKLPGVMLGNSLLQWVSSVKYLGITFCSGNNIKVDIDFITRKFYAASNSIFSNSRGLSELMQLHLQQAYCLPILQYATAAVNLTQAQLSTLNACWNNVYRKIFGFNKWDSVRMFIGGLGNLDYTSLRCLAMYNLFNAMINSNNNVVKMLVNMFCLSKEYSNLCGKLEVVMLNVSKSVFKSHILQLFLSH